MNHEMILQNLRKEFSGRKIICLPEDGPLEIIVELEADEQQSTAIAIIDRSIEHVHHVMIERYIVETGVLRVHVDDETCTLYPGDKIDIYPGQAHWAEGVATRVRIIATPPWTPGDHHLVKTN